MDILTVPISILPAVDAPLVRPHVARIEDVFALEEVNPEARKLFEA